MIFLFTFLKVFLREEQSSKLIMGNVRRLRHINLSLVDFQGNEHVIDISKCDYIVNRWIGIEESLCDIKEYVAERAHLNNSNDLFIQ